MTGNLSQRRPVWSCGDIFAATAGAAKPGPDLRHRNGWAKPRNQNRRCDNRIVATTIAPTEDINRVLGQIPENGLDTVRFLSAQIVFFDTAHYTLICSIKYHYLFS
jgi:hypothetical protein|tara:strand:- start:33508 stop:33825 length:318 start_codon:yes stop_codon:yes gene_type:complete